MLERFTTVCGLRLGCDMGVVVYGCGCEVVWLSGA